MHDARFISQCECVREESGSLYFVPNLEISAFILLSNINPDKPCIFDIIYEERKNAQSEFSYNLVIILLIYHIHHIVYKVIQSAVIEMYVSQHVGTI